MTKEEMLKRQSEALKKIRKMKEEGLEVGIAGNLYNPKIESSYSNISPEKISIMQKNRDRYEQSEQGQLELKRRREEEDEAEEKRRKEEERKRNSLFGF